MGACHSDLKHKGDSNSLEDYETTTVSDLSLTEGKEPPSFEELCARQQDLFARSDALKSTVAQQTQRRSFRSELADIVLKGPRRPMQPPEEESEVMNDVCEPAPSMPRVKLGYRRPTLDDNSTPEMKDVVNKYFDTLEELKRFVVSDEIYLDGKAPSTEDKAGDDDQNLRNEERCAESDDVGAQESAYAEPSTAAKNEVVVEQVDFLAPSAELESQSASVESTEHSTDILKEESSSPRTTSDKKKKKKSRKAKKTRRAFSCFSSESCE